MIKSTTEFDAYNWRSQGYPGEVRVLANVARLGTNT